MPGKLARHGSQHSWCPPEAACLPVGMHPSCLRTYVLLHPCIPDGRQLIDAHTACWPCRDGCSFIRWNECLTGKCRCTSDPGVTILHEIKTLAPLEELVVWQRLRAWKHIFWRQAVLFPFVAVPTARACLVSTRIHSGRQQPSVTTVPLSCIAVVV